MPLADFAGRFGWGYDGVNLFAPCRLYGTPRRLPGVRRRRAPARDRASFSTSSTTTSGPTATTSASSPPRYLSGAANRVGRRPQFRRAELGGRARVCHRQRALLDRGIPPRRSAPRRHAADLRLVAAAHHRGHSRRGARRVGRARRRSSSRENEPQDARLFAPRRRRRIRARRAVERRLPSRGAGSPPRGATKRTSAATAAWRRSSCRRRSTAFCIRGSGSAGRTIGAERRRSISIRRTSSPSRRITIRSRTRRAAGGCIRRRVRGAVARSRR